MLSSQHKCLSPILYTNGLRRVRCHVKRVNLNNKVSIVAHSVVCASFSNNMGSLAGHLLPGSIFLTISIWWFIGEMLQKVHRSYRERVRRSPGRRSTLRGSNPYVEPLWYSCPCARFSKLPVEPAVKVSFAVLGVSLELYGSVNLFDENGDFIAGRLDNYAHSVMYGFFGLSGAVEIVMWYRLLPLPPKFDYFVMSLAFWIEGFLFFFHLHGRNELNVRLHVILYILIFVTAFVFLLAAIIDQFMPLAFFLKSYLLSLQGSWFFQAGFVLFGPDPWKNSPSNVKFLGIAFAFHALSWFVVHLIFRLLCYHCYIKKQRLDESLYEETSGDDYDCERLRLEEL